MRIRTCCERKATEKEEEIVGERERVTENGMFSGTDVAFIKGCAYLSYRLQKSRKLHVFDK